MADAAAGYRIRTTPEQAAGRYFIIGGDCKNEEQLELNMMQLRSYELLLLLVIANILMLLHLNTILPLPSY